MRVLFWTEQARADLAAIRAFIGQDSPHYAAVIIARLITATGRLVAFPESGRTVPHGASCFAAFSDGTLTEAQPRRTIGGL